MVNYSKWDAIDSDEDEPKQTRSEILPDRYQHHQQSTALIATWLIEARPSLTEQETAKLMDFISIQHPGIHPHNIMRHQGITAFLEQAEANGTMPSEHALMALGNIARVRSESADAEVAGRGKRILMVAMTALNTLVACQYYKGGARQIFDELLREPDGDLAKQYIGLDFAQDFVRNPPPDEPDDDDFALEGEPSRWQRFRRALIINLMMAVIAAALLQVYLPMVPATAEAPTAPAPSPAGYLS